MNNVIHFPIERTRQGRDAAAQERASQQELMLEEILMVLVSMGRTPECQVLAQAMRQQWGQAAGERR